MFESRRLTIILLIAVLFILVLSLAPFNYLGINIANNQWVDVYYAAILAVIVGLAIEYLYKRFSAKSKFSRNTVTKKPRKLFAKCILPNDQEFVLNEYEKVFGREDFVGIALADELLFIGKNHLKITKMEDGVYIEDLDTKNGTMINGKEITGLGKIRLNDGDGILVAKTLNIKYSEEMV